MTIMTHAAQLAVLNTTSAHHALIANATELFHWFENAVAGTEAKEDIDAKLLAVNTEMAKEDGLHETLRNEWTGYVGSLSNAYAQFGRDIVQRTTAEEQLRTRNLALSNAGTAFTRIRTRAREYLVNKLESVKTN